MGVHFCWVSGGRLCEGVNHAPEWRVVAACNSAETADETVRVTTHTYLRRNADGCVHVSLPNTLKRELRAAR